LEEEKDHILEEGLEFVAHPPDCHTQTSSRSVSRGKLGTPEHGLYRTAEAKQRFLSKFRTLSVKDTAGFLKSKEQRKGYMDDYSNANTQPEAFFKQKAKTV